MANEIILSQEDIAKIKARVYCKILVDTVSGCWLWLGKTAIREKQESQESQERYWLRSR